MTLFQRKSVSIRLLLTNDKFVLSPQRCKNSSQWNWFLKFPFEFFNGLLLLVATSLRCSKADGFAYSQSKGSSPGSNFLLEKVNIVILTWFPLSEHRDGDRQWWGRRWRWIRRGTWRRRLRRRIRQRRIWRRLFKFFFLEKITETESKRQSDGFVVMLPPQYDPAWYCPAQEAGALLAGAVSRTSQT